PPLPHAVVLRLSTTRPTTVATTILARMPRSFLRPSRVHHSYNPMRRSVRDVRGQRTEFAIRSARDSEHLHSRRSVRSPSVHTSAFPASRRLSGYGRPFSSTK